LPSVKDSIIVFDPVPVMEEEEEEKGEEEEEMEQTEGIEGMKPLPQATCYSAITSTSTPGDAPSATADDTSAENESTVAIDDLRD